MPSLPTGGASIYWEAAGPENAPLLVMVHGAWSDHFDFTLIAPVLAGRFRVLTYDRRGHSASSAPPGQGSVRQDVADLAALIEAQGGGPAYLYGHSAGANIAIRFALEHPELIARLVVHEPPLPGMLSPDTPGLEGMAQHMGKLVELLMTRQHAEAAEFFVDAVIHTPGTWATLPQVARDTMVRNAATFRDDIGDPDSVRLDLDRLAGLATPFMLTRGTTSAPLFAAGEDLIRGALPGARYETIEGADHQPHLSHVETYAALLTEFFTGPPG